PKPDADKKKAAIFKAMAAFDEKSASLSQGKRRAGRPTGTAWAGFADFLRESVMTKVRIAAGACAAIAVVLTAAFFTLSSPAPQIARLASPPALKEAPGGAASPYFLEQQKTADAEREKKALSTGGSALPAPVGQNAGIDLTAASKVTEKDV